MIGLLMLGNVVVVHTILSRSQITAATVNLAGKMRMLSQRMAMQALAARQIPGFNYGGRDIDESFDAVIHALRHGGTTFGLTVPSLPGRLLAHLDDADSTWQSFRVTLEEYRTATNQLSNRTLVIPRMSDAHATGQLLSSTDHLLIHTENLVDAITSHAQRQQQGMLYTTYALFAIDTLLLILCYLLFSRVVLRPVKTLTWQSNQMRHGNYAARSQIAHKNELGQLGHVLNQSGEQIESLLYNLRKEQLALAETQTMFTGLANNTVAGVFVMNHRLELVYANEQLAVLSGHALEALNDQLSLDHLFDPDAFKSVRRFAKSQLTGQLGSVRRDITARHADGRPVEVEIFTTRLQLHGRPAIIGIVVDITERRQAEASARRAEIVYQHTTEAMAVTDANGIILDVNPAFTVITGYERDEVIDGPITVLSSGHHDKAFYEQMWASLLETGHWSGDIRNRRKSGEEFIEHLSINTSYNDDGTVACRIALFSDVTQERQREAIIWRQAHFDHLTKLPNRQMFYDTLNNSIARTQLQGLHLGLLFLDLDLFKDINDTFGHDHGDELLRQVAARLQKNLRGSDQVARLGGDEFTIILHDLKTTGDIKPICEKLLHALAQPYELSPDVEVTISASMGVAFYPQDGQTVTDLLKNADTAMYASKEKGRNQYCIFSPAMLQAAQTRRSVLFDLNEAIRNEEFTLLYQPIINLETGLIEKAEALIRWQHPTRGVVSPDDFISLAEDSGLIIPIGDWVLQESVRQVARIRQELNPDFTISINVSPAQIHANGINLDSWRHALKAAGLPGSAIMLEITEGLFLDMQDHPGQPLRALQDMGVAITLDDFGTGYSSLAYLIRYRIDFLKIDKSFIQGLRNGTENENMAVCQAIMAMAKELDIQVIAEGITTAQQHAMLQAAGCNLGQGFGYSVPVSIGKLHALIARGALPPPHQKATASEADS
ncbi:MAG TPA: EAL domain-containing protein [Burkholderiaceae bacterium]|nr:EAL domain-containing protein [Burkholderiaceae bacterium]